MLEFLCCSAALVSDMPTFDPTIQTENIAFDPHEMLAGVREHKRVDARRGDVELVDPLQRVVDEEPPHVFALRAVEVERQPPLRPRDRGSPAVAELEGRILRELLGLA